MEKIKHESNFPILKRLKVLLIVWQSETGSFLQDLFRKSNKSKYKYIYD